MAKSIIVEGKTSTEAIEKGLKELKVSKDKVDIKILENEAKKNNCWKDRIYCNRFVLAEPVSKRYFSVCFF